MPPKPLTLRERAVIVVGLTVLSLLAALAERLDQRDRRRRTTPSAVRAEASRQTTTAQLLLVQDEAMLTIASVAGTHWHDGQGWDGPPWPAFFLIPLLLAAAFLAGALLQRSRRPPGAVEIVAARYAQGEIDEDEYRRRVSELRGKATPRPTSGPT